MAIEYKTVACSLACGFVVLVAALVCPWALQGVALVDPSGIETAEPGAKPQAPERSDDGRLPASAPDGCEGYWPEQSICLSLGPGVRHFAAGDPPLSRGCPQRRITSDWLGKHEFLHKIYEIEDVARATGKFISSAQQLSKCDADQEPFVLLSQFYGVSWSRLVPDSVVGGSEFAEVRGGRRRPCWPEGFSRHYVAKFNVTPTEAFAAYVRGFDLEAFKAAAERVKACLANVNA